MIDLSVLVTESRNKETMGLDQMTPLEIVTVMNREDGKAVSRALRTRSAAVPSG